MLFIATGSNTAGESVFEKFGLKKPEPTIPVFSGVAGEEKLPSRFIPLGTVVEGDLSSCGRYVEINNIAGEITGALNLYVRSEDVTAAAGV